MSQLGLANNIATATGARGNRCPSSACRLPSSGKSIGPKLAGVFFLSFAYSAYDRYSHGLAWKPFVATGILSLAIVPYTGIFMATTNDKLMAGAQGVMALGWSETKELLTRWQTLNFVRSFWSLGGAAVGLWYSVFQ